VVTRIGKKSSLNQQRMEDFAQMNPAKSDFNSKFVTKKLAAL
jgi:hypothetical protein